MRFDIISIFPEVFNSYFSASILARAQKKKLIKIKAHDLRKWATDKHKKVDDQPYGGGPGMVLKVDVIDRAVLAIKKFFKGRKRRVILFSAKGKTFAQADAKRLAEYEQLILICGRYEGVDERVAEYIADEELSVGNFVLTGGEIPAMIVVDAVSRLVPGVLGKEASLKDESFCCEGYQEYPQYTRPENFKKWQVPEILLNGNHQEIEEWRKKNSHNDNS